MSILAIIVLYNGKEWIDKCLSSIAGSSVSMDVLVIDNCSNDGGAQFISEHFPSARVISNEENLGFGAANNIGLKYALKQGYNYVYLLNQDAYLEQDTIAKLLDVTDPTFGVLSPLQKAADGSLDANFAKKCLSYLGKNCSTKVVEVPFVMAAHWLINMEAVRKVGGFSPVFNQYGEDDNFIDRLHYHGLKCGVVKESSAVHDRAERVDSREKRLLLKCIASVVRLSNPNYPFVLYSVLEPIRLIATAIKNRSVLLLRYIPKLIRCYPSLWHSRKISKSEGAFL